MLDWNLILFQKIHSLAFVSGSFDTLVIFCATSLGTISIMVAIFFLLFHTDIKKGEPLSFSHIGKRIGEVLIVFITSGLAWLVSLLLKYLFHAPRPYLGVVDLQTLFPYGAYDSFPSGHATFFSALAVAIYLYHPRIGILFGFGVLIIGLSRIIAGVHYPIDIIGGFVIGTAVAFFVHRKVRGWIKKVLQ